MHFWNLFELKIIGTCTKNKLWLNWIVILVLIGYDNDWSLSSYTRRIWLIKIFFIKPEFTSRISSFNWKIKKSHFEKFLTFLKFFQKTH